MTVTIDMCLCLLVFRGLDFRELSATKFCLGQDGCSLQGLRLLAALSAPSVHM